MTSNKILFNNAISNGSGNNVDEKRGDNVATGAVAVASATADATFSVDYGKLQAVTKEDELLELSADKADTEVLIKEIKRILCKKLHPSERENHGVIKCGTVPKRAVPHWWSSWRLDASCRQLSQIWYEDYYCHCKSIWVCPRCAPVIAFGRRFIVRDLIVQAKREDNKECYLLTLTTRHDFTMSLDETLSKLEDANSRLWADWKVKQVKNESFVGRVTVLEIMYGKNGWHPHFHILLVGEKGLNIKELLKLFNEKWLAMLKKVGLEGLDGYACNLEACKDVNDYLTKIPCEICGVSKKDGKFPKHLNFFQLVSKCAQTPNGQRKRKLENLIFEYYEATKHRQFMHFSRGLKERYGVEDESEETFMDRMLGVGNDYKHLGRGFAFDEGYENLTAEEISKCLHAMSGRVEGFGPREVEDFLKSKGVAYHFEDLTHAEGFTGDKVDDAFIRYIRQIHKKKRREARIYNPEALERKRKELEQQTI